MGCTIPFQQRKRAGCRSVWNFTTLPNDASWLNRVEIELGVLHKQRLDRRIPNRPTLEREIAAWEKQRNDSRARITWFFDHEKTRQKACPKFSATDQNLWGKVLNPVYDETNIFV